MIPRRAWLRRSPLRRGKHDIRATPVHDLETGDSFDSTGECVRYRQLQLLERAGEIHHLILHPKYVLIPQNGRAREISLRCDYQYEIGSQIIVEDFKPRPATPRENLMFRIWHHFGPHTLKITGENGVVLKLITRRAGE